MRRPFTVAAVTALGALLVAPVALASPDSSSVPSGAPVETVARVRVDSTQALRELGDAGFDVVDDVTQAPDGAVDATVILPGSDIGALTARGARVLDTLPAPSQAELRGQLAGNRAPLTTAEKAEAKPRGDGERTTGSNRPAPVAEDGSLTILRADRWTNPDGDFLSVEVRSDEGAADDIEVTTDTGQVLELDPFVDRVETGDVYLYHRLSVPVPTDGVVMEVTATSPDGSEVTAETREWAPGEVTAFPDGFEWGFMDEGYVDPMQSDAIVEELAAEFPDLAEVIDLPYETHGYNLPTGNDELQAPDSYPHTPYTVKALRIGATRDGSKTGVLMYAQEHSREWVTSLTALETAQRLLHNYGTDETTTALVDDLDIFIIPIVNPDGTTYSLYDNRSMRTNMNVDDCPYGDDPTNAGININRNFSVGSIYDGYVGASLDCTRGSNFAGDSEISEAESKNEVYLTSTYPNIEFAMNTHSYGGYFMWSPASYLPDRTPLPRPDFATEQFFYEASETILSRIKEFRGTVVWPGRTGPVIDVLYSAAGNSGDEHFYDDEVTSDPEIYAWDFEVGASLWDAERQRWTGAGGFWPDFEEEGFAQGMEFANGWYGILEVARDFSLDDEGPSTTANVDQRGTYDGPVDVFFDTSEAATIYYTTDGSRPTFDSQQVVQDGVRAGAAPVTISDRGTTILQWFAVDEAGNVEGGYDPDTKSRKGLNRTVVKIRG